MEERFSCKFSLTLQEIALRKAVISLFNESDVLALWQYESPDCKSVWQETVEDKVYDKVSDLNLPESISKLMFDIVAHIGSEIRNWKRYHENMFCNSIVLDVPFLKLLVWTSVGSVDYGKTAEELIRFEMLDVEKNFKLACFYCLVNYIPHIWKELPEESMKSILRRDPDEINSSELPLWFSANSGVESGRLFDDLSSHRIAFKSAARQGNRAATEYYFQKLPNAYRDALFLDGSADIAEAVFKQIDSPLLKLSDVLFFLLSKMSTEQQMQFLRQYIPIVLRWFLVWPWQDLFLNNADLIWSFIPETGTSYISMKSLISDATRNSTNLFYKFFLSSPRNFRKHFMNLEGTCSSLMFKFCMNTDTESIKLIFGNIDAEDRAKYFCSSRFLEILEQLARVDKWQFIEFCFREASLSKEDMERVKGSFTEKLVPTKVEDYPLQFQDGVRQRNRILKRLFEFIDEFDAKRVKRSCEDETRAKAKKLCSEEDTNDPPRN